MKIVAGSVGPSRGGRARGGRASGGRGGGRGGDMPPSSTRVVPTRGATGSRGHGRGRGVAAGNEDAPRHARDKRFASRFTDPRFASTGNDSSRIRRDSQQAVHDPRFSALGGVAENESSDEGEEDEEAFEENEEEDVPLDNDELLALDEDAAEWSGSDVDVCEARRRVAIVNCDWDHVRAVDLYAILFHALPLGGELKDVSIYQSEFGKKMIQQEREHGPDLWVREGDEGYEKVRAAAEKDRADAVAEVAEDDDGDVDESGWINDDFNMIDEQGENGEWFSTGKYRKYERDRMKYYYAVATFDSLETAAHVYDEVDGMDVEASGVVLDLRYIDDDEMFEAPVSKADRVPPNFKPLSAFKVSALTQSRFKISWDQDDVFRNESLRDSFVENTAESDLAAYIAPASDTDDDGDDEAREREKRRIRKRYASLLAEIGVRADDQDENAATEDVDDDESSDSEFNPVANADDVSSAGESIEAALDLDADAKASHLQRGANQRRQLAEADVGEKQQLKYKERRKAVKKNKKELLRTDRDAEKALASQQAAAEKNNLRKMLGDVALPETEMASGKQKKKLHAQQKKMQIAQEREQKKKSRVTSALGLSSAVQARLTPTTEPASDLDDRFKQRLLHDPRYHLEVAQRDKKTKAPVQNLAAQIVQQRRVTPAAPEAKRPAQRADTSVDDAVGFFMNRPAKKSRKE